MQKITLDFSGCTGWYEIFDEIIKKCDFPQWCGKNIDAIWELMEDDFVLCNKPTIITITGTKQMTQDAFLAFSEINEKVFTHVSCNASNVKFQIIS